MSDNEVVGGSAFGENVVKEDGTAAGPAQPIATPPITPLPAVVLDGFTYTLDLATTVLGYVTGQLLRLDLVRQYLLDNGSATKSLTPGDTPGTITVYAPAGATAISSTTWNLYNGTQSVTVYGQTVIGDAAAVTQNQAATSVGQESAAVGDRSTAYGRNSLAYALSSTAIGDKARAEGQYGTALGADSYAPGMYATALGTGAIAYGTNSTALGYMALVGAEFSTPETSIDATAVGSHATATGQSSIALGNNTQATGGNSTALGTGSAASGTSTLAIGVGALASATNALAVGTSAVASAISAVVVGVNAVATGTFSTAIGTQAAAMAQYVTAVGSGANGQGIGATAIGRSATAIPVDSVAIGNLSQIQTGSDRSIVIGKSAVVGTNLPDYGVMKINTLELVPSRPSGGNDPTTLKLHDSAGAVHTIGADGVGITIDGQPAGVNDIQQPFALNSGAKASTTNTSTFTEYLSYDFPLDAGNWGFNLLGIANMFRSVNTGGMMTRVSVGTDTRDATLTSTDATLTTPHAVFNARGSNAVLNMPVAGTVHVALSYRGATTAGTTTIENATLSGTFWRVP